MGWFGASFFSKNIIHHSIWITYSAEAVRYTSFLCHCGPQQYIFILLGTPFCQSRSLPEPWPQDPLPAISLYCREHCSLEAVWSTSSLWQSMHIAGDNILPKLFGPRTLAGGWSPSNIPILQGALFCQARSLHKLSLAFLLLGSQICQSRSLPEPWPQDYFPAVFPYCKEDYSARPVRSTSCLQDFEPLAIPGYC